MKHPVAWRSFVRGGLASLAILAVLFSAGRIREALDPPDAAPTVPERPIAPAVPARPIALAPVGPAMWIDPGELAGAGRERDDNGLEMKFCWCPPGSFHMGLVDGRENSGVGVTLRQGYWMGKFEVTQSQWLRVMGMSLREQRAQDPTQPRAVGDGTMRDHVGEGPDHPIYFTSHADSEEFCRRLTAAERQAGRLEPGWDYRLPTEAQWEFACRAGSTTGTAFGDRLSSTQANFDGTRPYRDAPAGPYLREVTPVGSYPPNVWGLHDMHGNLYEWCLAGDGQVPPAGPGGSSPGWAIRGGCWHDPGARCLSTSGVEMRSDARGSGLGFRVAMVPSDPSSKAREE